MPDHDRPLAVRGQRAAARVAAHLKSAGPRPDLVLCSSARRAQETLEGLRAGGALPTQARVEVDPSLYGASASDLLRRLRDTPARRRAVLVIGHDPGISDLAGSLTGGGDPELVARMAAKFPTAGLATLSVDCPWEKLNWGSGRLQDFVVPRALE